MYNFSLSRPLSGEMAPACWQRLADFKRWPHWNRNVREVSWRPPGETGRGSVLEIETISGGRLDWTIVHWEPEVRVVFVSKGRLQDCAWSFEMPADSTPGERRLNLLLELQFRRGAWLLGWCLNWRLRRQANRFLNSLCEV